MASKPSTPTVISSYGTADIKGYKMMKISKTLANGKDISDVLSTLQSITIPSTNYGPLTFNIISAYNYTNYYLYYISFVELDSVATFNAIPEVVLSPGIAGFVSSDNDASYGYVDTPQFSTRIMEPDYGWEGGISTPSNFELIMNGIADRAPFQDSNHSSKAWSNVRYNGSRISSLGFNIASPVNPPSNPAFLQLSDFNKQDAINAQPPIAPAGDIADLLTGG
jgi:hypothetical protein